MSAKLIRKSLFDGKWISLGGGVWSNAKEGEEDRAVANGLVGEKFRSGKTILEGDAGIFVWLHSAVAAADQQEADEEMERNRHKPEYASYYAQQKACSSSIVDVSQVLIGDGRWAVLLCHGGRFSGAFFERGVPDARLHKSFGHYVVRAKSGGRQANKDSRKPGISSMGSSMRREHERKHAAAIQSQLLAWADPLNRCNRVFIHAPGPLNWREVAGWEVADISLPHGASRRNPLLDLIKDGRLRRCGLNVGRPSFEETCRVSTELSSIWIQLPEDDNVCNAVLQTPTFSSTSLSSGHIVEKNSFTPSESDSESSTEEAYSSERSSDSK